MSEARRFSLGALSARPLLAGVVLALLAGCSGLPSFLGGSGPRPAELQPNPGLLPMRQAWHLRLDQVRFPLTPAVTASTVTVASSEGMVLAIDAASGREQWRVDLRAPIAAGVGSDGELTAVVTTFNELVALKEGKVVWREKLPAQAYTAPLVAGARVFVLAADRSVSAFDGATGRKLWTQQRPGEPLVLRQAGVLLPVGDTLVVGQGGRLVGLNPSAGSSRWEAPLANPRGINDVERLVDLVGRVSRVGESVCARAFQAAVGCVDTRRGTAAWTQRASGSEGLHGDEAHVYGAESDGKVVAWRRENGQRVWTHDKLLYRALTAPLAMGRAVAVGDSTGFVHLLSREDGSLLNRLTADGSAIAAAPVMAGNTLVVVTRKGGIFGYVSQ